ncbi:MAG: hypothetical protein M3024_09275, partial [Candidatus Dormibacteraeota bacterium]|nr:hypothetical protein [Candidatus Dormibacteraeota bacterium]
VQASRRCGHGQRGQGHADVIFDARRASGGGLGLGKPQPASWSWFRPPAGVALDNVVKAMLT